METLTLGVTLWLVAVAFGAAIGYSRRNMLEGILWPAILGPLGLLLAVAFVKRPTEVRP